MTVPSCKADNKFNGDTHSIMVKYLRCMIALCLLSACGGNDILQGDRLDVLGTKTALQVDVALAQEKIRLDEAGVQINWPQYRGNAQHLSVNNRIDFARNKPLWHQDLGKGDRDGIFIMAQPVIFADMLYWVDNKFRLTAHRLDKKAKRLFRVKLPVPRSDRHAYGAGVAVNSEFLIVSTGAGFVYGYSRDDGTLLWQSNLRHPIHSTPTIQGSDIYVTTINNITFALDIASGATKWQHESVSSRVALIQSISPAVAGNWVIAGYANGDIVAISRVDGETVWKQNLATSSRVDALGQIASIVNGFVVAGPRIFASSYSGKLVALDAQTGTIIWEIPLSASTPMSVSGDYVFVLDDQSVLYALRQNDGKVRWAQELQNWEKGEEGYERVIWNGPLLSVPYLVMANHEKKLLLYNVETGAEIKKYKFGDGFRTHPISSNGVLYIIDSNGKLYALN